MPQVTVSVQRVGLSTSEDSVLVDLSDNRVLEIFGDGTVQIWSPEALVDEVSL